jgi:hypothetical protein
MTPKPTDLVSAQLVREQSWAYDLWRQRFGAMDVPRLSKLSLEQGGLGYELPASAFRGLVDGFRERMGLGGISRQGRIDRQLDELDTGIRLVTKALRQAAEVEALDLYALDRMLKLQEREAKLLGLDAATKIEAEVTTYDGASAELAAMLAEAGIEQDTKS